MLLEEKLVVTEQDTASKDTFFFYKFNISKQYRPKNQSTKNEECHTGEMGSEKFQKSVTYYLNGPLHLFF